MHAEGVVGAGAGAARRYQTMPDIAGAARQIVTRNLGAARGVVQTDFDASGIARKQGEVHAALGPSRAQRPWRTEMDNFHATGPVKNIAANGGKFNFRD